MYKRIVGVVICLFSVICVFAKTPFLMPFLADSTNNTHIAMIVCPGGSYSWLAMQQEGEKVAQFFQQQGINMFVLKYRVATVAAYITGFRVLGFGNKYPDMLEDVEKALQIVYQNAHKWAIDTSKIGMMGFSAGGHLAMMSYLHNQTPYKPKFLCPIYPVVTFSDKRYVHKRSRRGALGVWRQWNKNLQDSLSLEKHVPDDSPPVFLANCKDDKVVKYQNSQLLDSALTAHHIPHEYHLYESGGHGFGVGDDESNQIAYQWKNKCLQWILNFNQQPK